MRLGNTARKFASAVVLLLAFADASATPLTGGDPAAPSNPVWTPASAAELAQANPWFDTAANEPVPTTISLREVVNLEGAAGWNEAAAAVNEPFGARSVSEQLREILNVEPLGPGTGGRSGGTRAGKAAPPAADIDLGAVADAWIRETVQSLVQATLRLSVNEAGQATFSVMGLGEFTLSLSGDRSRLTLAEGGEVLLSLQRPQAPPPSGSRPVDVPAIFPGAAGTPEPLDGQPSILRAIALVTDVASHPLSLLMYCVAAGYLLLWGLLSQQQRRRGARTSARAAGKPLAAPSSTRQHQPRLASSLHRSRPAGNSGRRAGSSNDNGRSGTGSETGRSYEPAAATHSRMPTGERRRKRVRIRIRTRVRRRRSSRESA